MHYFTFFSKCLGSSQVLKIKVPGGHEDLKNGMRYQIHQDTLKWLNDM